VTALFLPVRHGATSWTRIESIVIILRALRADVLYHETLCVRRLQLCFRRSHFSQVKSSQVVGLRTNLLLPSVSHPLHFCGVGVTIFSLHIFWHISVSHPLHFCGVGVTIFSLHIFFTITAVQQVTAYVFKIINQLLQLSFTVHKLFLFL
jgi:hypothetical protein